MSRTPAPEREPDTDRHENDRRESEQPEPREVPRGLLARLASGWIEGAGTAHREHVPF